MIDYRGQVALASPVDTAILIFGLRSGRILDTILVPSELRGSLSLTMTTDEAFALYDQEKIGVVTDDSLFVISWKNLLPDSVVRAVKGQIVLWDEMDCLVFQIFDGRLTQKKHEYDMQYLWCWSYRSGDSFGLPVRWDPMIGGPRFTMPRVYLTVSGGKLIASEAYSNRVAVCHNTTGMNENLWAPEKIAFTSFPRYSGTNIDEEIEFSLYQEVHHRSFGKAFWMKHSSWLESIRLYYPELPETDAFGRFLAGRDRPVQVLLRTTDGEYNTVSLPVNRYFVSNRWTMLHDTLYYAKWISEDEMGRHSFVVDALAFSMY